MTQNSWYLIYTKARQEDKAIINLEQQGFQTYFPQILNKKRLRGKWRTVREPLFPSYVFIQIDTLQGNWLPIRSTFGVRKIVSFGTKPAVVPTEIVASIETKIQSLDNEPGFDQVFQQGQKIDVVSGPFAGVEGIFRSYRGKDRVAILLSLLGVESYTTLDIHDIQPQPA